MQWTCTGTSFSRSMTAQNCSKSWSVGFWKSTGMWIYVMETAHTRRLVWQRLLMGVEPQVDDVADAKSVDISQLRFGRLAGCRYPVIETTPVVNRVRVGHGTPLLSLKTACAAERSGPTQKNPAGFLPTGLSF